MKKTLLIVLLFILLTSCGKSDKLTDKDTAAADVHTVNFVMPDGELIESVQVNDHEAAVPPEMKNNTDFRAEDYLYTFFGWDSDFSCVTSEMTVKALYSVKDLGFPEIMINTKRSAPIVSKEQYVECSVSVGNAEDEFIVSDVPAKIRGRGNSTFNLPKKPYRLKFDSKINFFGDGKAKNWVLIANHGDQSQLRNYITYKLGALCDDLKYTTTVRFVNLTLNGEYQGVYLVCEQIEAGKSRVNIEENETDPDTGYLVELDWHVHDEGVNDPYIVVDNNPYVIKSPDSEDITAVQNSFIQRYLWKCVSALNSKNWDSVNELMDTATFADSYIIHELTHTLDSGFSSFYMYKDKGGRLCSGPLWDFDVSMGNCYWEPRVSNPNELYAAVVNPWYKKLLEFPEFWEMIAEKLEKYKDVFTETIDSEIEIAHSREDKFLRNDSVWHTVGTYTWPNTRDIVRLKTYGEHIDYVKNFLHNSLDYMLKVYCNP